MSSQRSVVVSTLLVAFLAVFVDRVEAAPVRPVQVFPWDINNSSKLVIRPAWIMVPKNELVVLFTDAPAPSKAPTTVTETPVTSSEEITEPTTAGYSTTEPHETTETTDGALETIEATTESRETTDSSTEADTTTDAPEPSETTLMESSSAIVSTDNDDTATTETTETSASDPTEPTTDGTTSELVSETSTISEDSTDKDYEVAKEGLTGTRGIRVKVVTENEDDDDSDYTHDPRDVN